MNTKFIIFINIKINNFQKKTKKFLKNKKNFQKNNFLEQRKFDKDFNI